MTSDTPSAPSASRCSTRRILPGRPAGYRSALAARMCIALIATLLSSPGTGTADLTNGLVLLYAFDTDEGAIVTDQSDNGHTGTVSGATWMAEGHTGGGMSLDGVDDLISVSDEADFDFDIADDFTVCMWIKASSTIHSRVFLSKMQHMNDTGWEIFDSSGQPVFLLRQGVGNRILRKVNTNINDGAWHLWCFVWAGSAGVNPTNMHIFRDGTELPIAVDDSAGTIGTILNNLPVTIGADGDGNHNAFAADAVRIYNRALSSNDVEELYIASPDGNLILHYTFDTDEGAIVTDHSGNGHTGTVSGASWIADGQSDGAMSFDGSGDYINVANEPDFDFDISDDFTVSMWIKASTSINQHVFAAKIQHGNGTGWQIYDSAGQPVFLLRQGVDNRILRKVTANVNDGLWHLWNFVWQGSAGADPTNMHIFRDGAELPIAVDDSAGTITSMLNDLPVRLAANAEGNYNAFAVDQFKIHSCALSSNDIAALYTPPPSPQGEFLLHYTFDTDEGSTVTDQSGCGHVGTVSGATWLANGYIGGGMSFDGNGDYISVANESDFDFDVSDDFTVCMWIKASATIHTRVFISKMQHMNDTGWEVFDSAGQPVFLLRQGVANRILRKVATNINDGAWHLWSFVWAGSDGVNPTNMHIFRDDAELAIAVDDSAGTLGTILNDLEVRIAADGDGNYNAFAADDVRIYSRALSASEIETLHATGGLQPHDLVVKGDPAEHGQPQPQGYGTNLVGEGISYTNSVNSPAYDSATLRYLCTGWTGTGDIAGAGTETEVAFTVTQDSELTWHWSTEYGLNAQAIGYGKVSPVSGWFAPGSTSVTVTATPDPGYAFVAWSGATNGCTVNGAEITVPMTQPRAITAEFTRPRLGCIPTNLVFTGYLYETTAPQTLTITNAGDGTLSYTIGSNAAWLAVSSPTGAVVSGQAAQHSVVADAGALAQGTYQASLTVQAPGAADAPQLVPVTLTVGISPRATVGAMGNNESGQCNVPPGLAGTVVALAGGEYFSLALRANGTVVGWGANESGQSAPPGTLTDATAIAAGAWHGIALRANGTVTTWGDNTHGQRNVPGGLTDVKAVTAGWAHCVVLRSNGTVVAWGNNTYGECDVPGGLANVVAISAQSYGAHTLALRADGTVAAWGDNSEGQCNVPGGLNNATAVAAGGYHSLVLRSDSSLMAWGNNAVGQCDFPPDLTDPVEICAGEGFSMARRPDGSLAAWGYDTDGETDIPLHVSNVVAFAAGAMHSLAVGRWAQPRANDFDGDAKSDLGVYYPPGGNWYVLKTQAGFDVYQFGYAGTVPISGDMDGDTQCDFGVYFAPGGNWYVMKSRAGFDTYQFGYTGTIPVTGDFDGDRKCDFGVYYPPGGNWYIMKSRDGFDTYQFGYSGTVPITGDFDGDGRCDFGVYYPPGGNWYVMKSTDGFDVYQFGYVGTLPITGDFDGDGRCDFGVYYPPGGNWYVMKTQQGFDVYQFGYAGTVPLVGDYDGDGQDDFGVYYPPGGNWYVMRSSAGFWVTQFGYAGTIALGAPNY